MLQFFKTNNPSFILLFSALIIVLFRVAALFLGVEIDVWQESLAPVGRLLIKIIGVETLQNPITNLTLSGVFVGLQAWVVNQIANRYKLLERVSYLPVWVFILLAHLSPSFLVFSPITIASTFALFFFNIVSQESFTKSNVAKVFNLGLLISLACLTWYPALALLPFLLIVFFIKPSFTMKGLVALLIAIVIPFIYVFFYYFMIDGLEKELPMLFSAFRFNQLSFANTDWKDLVGVGILVLFSLLGAAAALNYTQRSSNVVRDLLSITFAFYFASIVGLLLQNNNHFNVLFLFATPIAILVSVFIHKIKNKRLAEIAHLTLFLSVIIYFTFIIYQP